MDDLIAFLNARLTALENGGLPDQHEKFCGYGQIEFEAACDCDVPKLVLADIDAKRQIIVEYVEAKQAYEGIAAIESWPDEARGRVERASYHQAMNALAHAVRLLALPFASHPDYRESWRP